MKLSVVKTQKRNSFKENTYPLQNAPPFFSDEMALLYKFDHARMWHKSDNTLV